MLGLKAPLSAFVLGSLIFLLACGGSAAPTGPVPTATQPATPVSTSPASETRAPTASPAATPEPTNLAAPTVNPGKVTWMVQKWGTGQFENVIAGTGVENQYTRVVHGFLIAADASGKMVPGIAKDWSVSSDGKTWTVTVRDGAMFHDGSPLTNKDVAWSWTHEWAPEALPYAKSTTSIAQANNTVSIQAVGDNQVTAVLKNADGGFPAGILSEAGPNWIGAIYPAREKAYDEAESAAYDKNPIGAGPMKVVRQISGELIAMERFDDFYYQPKNGLPEDRRVNFKSLDMRLIPELSTRVAAIRAGEADIAPVTLDSRQQVEAGGGRLIFGPEGTYPRPYLAGCWSPVMPPCKDKRVRQALAYAINKQLIADRLYGGSDVFVARGWAFVTPSSLGYSEDLDPFPYDPDKARQLLAEAGYPNGEGFGTYIINTYVSALTPMIPEQAQLVADMWRRELGIETDVRIGDQATLNNALRTEELWGHLYYRDNEARYDGGSILRSTYGTPEIGSRLHEDPELYAQVRAALAVTDPATRPAELNKIYKRLRDEQWEIGLGYVNLPWAVGPKVTAWQPFSFANYPSNLHNLQIK